MPPNAPPFASGDTGSPPGSHHDASGSRYAGSTHDVASRTPPSGNGSNGNGGAASAVVRRPCTLPAAVRAASNDSPVTHCAPHGLDRRRVGLGRSRYRDERVARRGVVGEPAPAERYRRIDALRDAALELRTRRGRGQIAAGAPYRGRRGFQRFVHRAPTRAPAEVRSQRPIERGRRAAAARITIPGVQNPHCDPPVATNAARDRVTRVGVESFHRRHRPARDARGRGDARDPRVAVDEHGAAAALALRRAAVLHRDEAEPLAQDRQQRFPGLDGDIDDVAVAGERHPIRHAHLRLGRIGGWSPAGISWPSRAASSCSPRAAAAATTAAAGPPGTP